jgi:hypothetical protein
MTKARRKDEIRCAARQQVAALQAQGQAAPEQDWRAIALDAILHGSSVSAAAKLAGVKRDRIYAETVRCPQFDRAFNLARYYGRHRIIWISRPIWPPSAETVQRHEATLQRIYDAPRCELVGPNKWR